MVQRWDAGFEAARVEKCPISYKSCGWAVYMLGSSTMATALIVQQWLLSTATQRRATPSTVAHLPGPPYASILTTHGCGLHCFLCTLTCWQGETWWSLSLPVQTALNKALLHCSPPPHRRLHSDHALQNTGGHTVWHCNGQTVNYG